MHPILGLFMFNPMELVILLIIALPFVMVKAARRGHAMPAAVCLMLIIIGAIMMLTPSGMSFLLQMAGRTPRISQDEQIVCWVVGGVLCFVGVMGSFLAKRVSPEQPTAGR